MELDKVLEALTPEIVEKFKSAIETGKWPDGKAVTKEQMAICIQAVIAYEHTHLPEQERTGYVPPKPEHTSRTENEPQPCVHRDQEIETLKWQDDSST